METGASEWVPPSAFEEYRLVRVIGAGAMGRVYLAHDELLDRAVAIKFVATEPDEAAREQFFEEARALARLAHPNVVTVFRAGEVRRRPYLVAELLRGPSLASIDRPLAASSLLKLSIGLARGLAAAHRAGVLHRDVKPANAMMTDEGEVKLVDFGLAQRYCLEGDGARPWAPASGAAGESASTVANPGPVGTPLYMAPEVRQGEPATRRSDVYSLGLLLRELATGTPPENVPGRSMLPSSTGWKLGSIPGTEIDSISPSAVKASTLGRQPLSALDARFAAIIERCLQLDPRDRYDSGDAVREVLEQLRSQDRLARVPEGSPYRGLEPFGPAQRDLFFGRDTGVRAVLDRLRARRCVLVVGESGSGKSSLCRAGVLPLVTDGELVPGALASTIELVPGRRPVAALAAAFAPFCPHVADLEQRLAQEPQTVARLVGAGLGDRSTLVIFVDQMEELLTISEPAEARAASLALAALAEGGRGVRLLAAARGDFLMRLAALPVLGEELLRGLSLLRPMAPDELREAITAPARAYGFEFESEALVAELMASASGTPGALPLLQFALAELWEARDVSRRMIPIEALRAVGGVEGALARHADSVMAALIPEERPIARRLFLRLVSPEGTAARRSEVELDVAPASASGPTPRRVLEALVRGRLIIARQSEDSHEGTFALAHEALLTHWDTLRHWLSRDADLCAVRHRVSQAAAEWERLQRAPEGLWAQRQLTEAAGLEKTELSTPEALFLMESRRASRRRRVRRVAAVLALPLTGALVYGATQLHAHREIDRTVAARIAEADGAVATARAGEAEANGRRREAFAAFDEGAFERGERLWSLALAEASSVDRAWRDADQALEAAHMLALEHREVGRRLGEVLFARATRAESDRNLAQRDDLLVRLRRTDVDGALMDRWNAPAALAIESRPPGARVSWRRALEEPTGGRTLSAPTRLGTTPIAETALDAGSYLLSLEFADRPPLAYPVRLMRGERYRIQVDLPSTIPEGMIFVAGGRFLCGSDDDERVRVRFLTAAPMHECQTASFLIARHETTWANWLEFLRALPESERERRRPHVTHDRFGSVELIAEPDGSYRLRLKPGSVAYEAREHEPIRYLDRPKRAAQDWLKMPVTGISYEDARAYLGWLDETGRLRGARFCDEREWERAARGADGRLFSHGDRLGSDDANHDRTYGQSPRAFGPDEVGAHPRSDSPFGVADLVGNVWEWVDSIQGGGAIVYRGGSYYQDALTARSDNRQQAGERTLRSARIGLRVCATPEALGR